jgi:ketosteroid isomerase-like protein
MSEEIAAVATADTRRPIAEQILLRMPFLVDFALARVARLSPGSPLRRRLVPWGLRRGFDAASRSDFDVPLLGYEPDVEIFTSGAAGLGLAESYSGHQGWRDFFEDFFEDFPQPHFSINRVLDAGDRWVAEVVTQAQGKASGVEVENTWATVYYLSPRGRIRRQDVFFQGGWKLALEAAGLSE